MALLLEEEHESSDRAITFGLASWLGLDRGSSGLGLGGRRVWSLSCLTSKLLRTTGPTRVVAGLTARGGQIPTRPWSPAHLSLLG